jgi:hypothetical protein
LSEVERFIGDKVDIFYIIRQLYFIKKQKTLSGDGQGLKEKIILSFSNLES